MKVRIPVDIYNSFSHADLVFFQSHAQSHVGILLNMKMYFRPKLCWYNKGDSVFQQPMKFGVPPQLKDGANCI